MCANPDCKLHSMWHTHPPDLPKAGMQPITPMPKINIKPFEVPTLFTVRDAIRHHEMCAKGNQKIIDGAQWPDSLKEFCKPLVVKHRFYAWVLSIALH